MDWVEFILSLGCHNVTKSGSIIFWTPREMQEQWQGSAGMPPTQAPNCVGTWKSEKFPYFPNLLFFQSYSKSFLNILEHNPSFPAQANKGNKWHILTSGSSQCIWNFNFNKADEFLWRVSWALNSCEGKGEVKWSCQSEQYPCKTDDTIFFFQ